MNCRACAEFIAVESNVNNTNAKERLERNERDCMIHQNMIQKSSIPNLRQLTDLSVVLHLISLRIIREPFLHLIQALKFMMLKPVVFDWPVYLHAGHAGRAGRIDTISNSCRSVCCGLTSNQEMLSLGEVSRIHHFEDSVGNLFRQFVERICRQFMLLF